MFHSFFYCYTKKQLVSTQDRFVWREWQVCCLPSPVEVSRCFSILTFRTVGGQVTEGLCSALTYLHLCVWVCVWVCEWVSEWVSVCACLSTSVFLSLSAVCGRPDKLWGMGTIAMLERELIVRDSDRLVRACCWWWEKKYSASQTRQIQGFNHGHLHSPIPHSYFSACFSNGTHRALVKSSAQCWEQGAISDTVQVIFNGWFPSPHSCGSLTNTLLLSVTDVLVCDC